LNKTCTKSCNSCGRTINNCLDIKYYEEFQERFDCNMISEEEWSKIENKFKYMVY
jgi:hypothetical protein